MPTRAVADDLGDVDAAVQWADAWLRDAGLPEVSRLDIQVCIEEALANLIRHGRATAGDKALSLAVSLDDGRTTVRIGDRCAPFDPTTATLPRAPTLAGAAVGGHGLRLIRGLAEHLAYRSSADGNELVMSFGNSGTG